MQFGTEELRRGAFGQPSVPFLLSRRAHLLTTPKGRWYYLRQPCALRGGCGFCGSLMDNATSRRCCCHCPRSCQPVLTTPNTVASSYGILPTASEKHQPDVFHCYGYRFFCDTHFLFATSHHSLCPLLQAYRTAYPICGVRSTYRNYSPCVATA